MSAGKPTAALHLQHLNVWHLQPKNLPLQVPDSEFVASRCAALEVWLRRLSAHPVIGHSQVRAGCNPMTPTRHANAA